MHRTTRSIPPLSILFLALAVTSGEGQVLSAEVDLGDWGISRAAELRYLEIGLLLEDGGPRLLVYDLSQDRAQPTLPGTDERGSTPGLSDGRLLISGLREGNRNALGGSFSIFASPPARGRATLGQAPDGGRALQIECQGTTTGFCGAWIHLFDSRLPPAERNFLDSREFSALNFRVWTDRSTDEFLLKVADADWEARGDAPSAGMLHELVPSGELGPRWQWVTMPLDRLDPSVQRGALASVILQSVSSDLARILVQDLMFVTENSQLPIRAEGEDGPKANSEEGLEPDRGEDLAVWIWNTERLLHDRRKAIEAIGFLVDHGVNVAFLQIPDGPAQRRAPGARVLETHRLRPLMSAFNSAGIRVYALDGAAWFANPPYHAGVIQTVRNVGSYNAAVSRNERFYGVRYDIEPYLLPGFAGWKRTQILRDLFSLVERITEEAHAVGLQVGLDIPFWYDAPNERTWERVDLEWNGAVRPASHHLMEIVDNVAVMAYRTTAYGADGTITHSEDELRFASSRGRKVYVGLETGSLPDEVLMEFWGTPNVGLPETEGDVGRLLVVERPDSIQLILVPAGESLRDLDSVVAVRPGSDRVLWWPVSREVAVPASKLSFGEWDAARMADVMTKTAFESSPHPSFSGFAIHDMAGWRELLNRP